MQDSNATLRRAIARKPAVFLRRHFANGLRVSWHRYIAILFVYALFVACHSGDDHAPPFDSTNTLNCTDKDGDGYGDGCQKGTDCDDDDSTVTNECLRCTGIGTGCSCAVEGQRAPCGEIQTIIAGQVTCGQGDRVCSDGIWGECIINKSVTLLPDGDPKTHVQVLGASSACTDPCDPYCHTWIDTPTQLTDTDAGIVGTDAGITLTESDTPVVVQSACSGGNAGSCAHHVCATGAALTQECDGASGGLCVAEGAACTAASTCCYGLVCNSGKCSVKNPGGRVEVFKETFAAGNAKG